MVALLGDALFGIQELWTAAHYRIPVVFVVVNNAQYGFLKVGGKVMQLPRLFAGALGPRGPGPGRSGGGLRVVEPLTGGRDAPDHRCHRPGRAPGDGHQRQRARYTQPALDKQRISTLDTDRRLTNSCRRAARSQEDIRA